MHCLARSLTRKFHQAKTGSGFRVVQKNVEGREPSREGFYLTNEAGQLLSFWNDVPLGLHND